MDKRQRIFYGFLGVYLMVIGLFLLTGQTDRFWVQVLAILGFFFVSGIILDILESLFRGDEKDGE
jgi:O-antigen ligase